MDPPGDLHPLDGLIKKLADGSAHILKIALLRVTTLNSGALGTRFPTCLWRPRLPPVQVGALQPLHLVHSNVHRDIVDVRVDAALIQIQDRLETIFHRLYVIWVQLVAAHCQIL